MKPEKGNYLQKNAQTDYKLFDELYEKYKSLVYGFAYYLTKNKGEAEDLFQDTWIRVVQNLPKNLNRKKCKAWLVTVTANLYRDTLRKKRIRRLFFLRKLKEFRNNHETSNFGPERVKPNKRDELENLDTGIAISQALAKLPDRQRLVFILKEIEGFQQAEISEILGIPLGTVKSLMYRAIRRLRRDLSAYKPKFYEERIK